MDEHPCRRRRGLGLLLPLLAVLAVLPRGAHSLPERGRWTLQFNSSQSFNGVVKNVFADTKIYIKVQCTSTSIQQKVTIGWILRETPCWNEYSFLDSLPDVFETYYAKPDLSLQIEGMNTTNLHYVKRPEVVRDCNGAIMLDIMDEAPEQSRNASILQKSPSGPITDKPQYNVPHSGDYLLLIFIKGDDFSATVNVEMKDSKGYLSIVDWPMLPFYGCMCALYILMGLVWLILCARHWRDLLRIQFWIGGVIFLGMLEKAMFLAEYSNIANSGSSTQGLLLSAEIISCAKRTLARMLVIIVSLGFGIVKPRLGPTLHRVIGIGGVYFLLASAEAYLRITKPKNDNSNTTLMAGIPLAVIDSSICWWVFSALVQTTRTLRLRRNIVKLALYRHFTNTLIFSVIASVLFMLWSIKYHKLEECLVDWRDLWIEDAFWHMLFSVILCVIMFLWRPSQNNQRYAFTPLLDHEDDEMSEDEDDPFFKGKVTLRNVGSGKSPKLSPKEADDDPMKWIEENIPESENPLPVLDSDEEIETTKFEISKMQ